MLGVGTAERKSLGSQIPPHDHEHEHVRQQLPRLCSEFAGEDPNFIGEKFAALPSKLGDAVFA